MEIIYSQNQSRTSRAVSFLKPSLLEAVSFITLAFFVLLALNYRVFTNVILDGATFEQSVVLIVHDDMLDILQQINQTFGAITVFAFWMMVGGVAYAVVWLVEHAAVDIYDDVEGSKAIAPGDYKIQYWDSVRAKYLAFIAISISTVGLVSLFMAFFMPALADQVIEVSLDPSNPIVYVKAVAAVLIAAIGLYSSMILFRILRYITAVVLVRD